MVLNTIAEVYKRREVDDGMGSVTYHYSLAGEVWAERSNEATNFVGTDHNTPVMVLTLTVRAPSGIDMTDAILIGETWFIVAAIKFSTVSDFYEEIDLIEDLTHGKEADETTNRW